MADPPPRSPLSSGNARLLFIRLGNGLEDLRVRRHSLLYINDDAAGIDDENRSLDEESSDAPIRLRGFAVRINEKWKRKGLAFDEFSMRGDIRGIDAENFDILRLEPRKIVPDRAELLCAPRRLVAGIENQRHIVLSGVVAQPNGIAPRALEDEIRRLIANFQRHGGTSG